MSAPEKGCFNCLPDPQGAPPWGYCERCDRTRRIIQASACPLLVTAALAFLTLLAFLAYEGWRH